MRDYLVGYNIIHSGGQHLTNGYVRFPYGNRIIDKDVILMWQAKLADEVSQTMPFLKSVTIRIITFQPL